jgi:hypothetical protein
LLIPPGLDLERDGASAERDFEISFADLPDNDVASSPTLCLEETDSADLDLAF